MGKHGVPIAGFLLLLAAASGPTHAAPVYGWRDGPVGTDTLDTRFPTPKGFRRAVLADGSFAEYTRHLPMKAQGAPLRLYSGTELWLTPHVAGVIDLDVGPRDLQQCADTVVRLHAEYLYANGQLPALVYRFTSGDAFSYADYLAGRRPVPKGRGVSWSQVAPMADSRAAFRGWLDIIFTYLGTASLARDLRRVAAADIRPGDVFVAPGYPGHAVLVADMAVNDADEKRLLLVEGFTPAQDAHVLRHLMPFGDNAAWFAFEPDGKLETAVWTFLPGELYRLP
ncbi:MAG: hypothetical protein EP335_09400 [Alphaproteobacteria bacterium]|nr:MAG: hypothetical protein EP335_09400 [Alphaproteobacteria bacterium]